MSAVGKMITFAVGAAIGAAGGIAASRLVAPQSGDETQQTVLGFRNEVVAAGAAARAQKEADLSQQFRQTVGRVAVERPT